jgi:Putative addiction module component
MKTTERIGVAALPEFDAAEFLDSDEAVAAWDALADEREAELESGAVQAVPLDVALARLEAHFPG